MLTQNQFKTHYSWQNTVIIPALVLFAICFSTKSLAQVTDDENAINNSSSLSEFRITSTMTDAELAEKVAYYKNEFGLTLNIKKIIRTGNDEINGIKMVFSNAKGAKQGYNVLEDDPIEPINIFVKTRGNNPIAFGFGDPDLSVDIEEDDAQISANASQIKSSDNKESKVMASGSSNDAEISADQNRAIDYEKAYISVDGKEISALEMELLDPKTIGSTTKLNSANNDKLVEKYGEKARYGVVLIETTIDLQELTSAQISKLPESFKLDAYNGSFVIHKNTQNSDLEFFEKQLARIGVGLEVQEVERDKRGFITNLKLKLHDNLKNAMMADWLIYKNSNGIISIVVGRKNGKVSVYSI